MDKIKNLQHQFCKYINLDDINIKSCFISKKELTELQHTYKSQQVLNLTKILDGFYIKSNGIYYVYIKEPVSKTDYYPYYVLFHELSHIKTIDETINYQLTSKDTQQASGYSLWKEFIANRMAYQGYQMLIEKLDFLSKKEKQTVLINVCFLKIFQSKSDLEIELLAEILSILSINNLSEIFLRQIKHEISKNIQNLIDLLLNTEGVDYYEIYQQACNLTTNINKTITEKV